MLYAADDCCWDCGSLQQLTDRESWRSTSGAMASNGVSPKVDRVVRRLFALKSPKVPRNFWTVCSARWIATLDMAAEVLITAVLLLGWMEPGLMVDKFDILEFYAGKARVSRAAREAGLSAAALDVLYHENQRVLDMTSSPGFAFRDCISVTGNNHQIGNT